MVAGVASEILTAVADGLGAALGATNVVGTTSDAVLGGPHVIGGFAGVSVMALHLPASWMRVFTDDELALGADSADESASFREAFGAGSGDHRASLLLADPFSVSASQLCGGLDNVNRSDGPPIGAVVGGFGSGSTSAAGHPLYLNGSLRRRGVVGVSIGGAVEIDALLSGGCRSVGEPLVVTRAKGHMIFELRGGAAIKAAGEALRALGARTSEELAGNVYLGQATDEAKAWGGAATLATRRIVGVEPDAGAIALSEAVRPGRTVRFQIFDPSYARDDLLLALDAQRLRGTPAGAIVVSSRSRRGKGSDPHMGDAAAFQDAFRLPTAGSDLAKAGEPVQKPAVIPLVGLCSDGEVARSGSKFHMSHASVAALLFRTPTPLPTPERGFGGGSV